MKKKILFVLPDTEMGGAERQAVLLAKSLCYECEVDFLCFHFNNHKYTVSIALENTPIKITVIESIFPKNFLSRLYRLFQFALFCLRKRYYAVLPYLYEMGLNVGMLRKLGILKSKKIIWNQRDEGFGGKLNSLNSKILPSFDAFISNSIGGCKFLENSFLIPPEKIHYVKNGVEIQAQKSKELWREENSIDKNEFVACMLANIQCNKDHITVIKAIKRLLDRGISLKMLFVGYAGDTISMVEKYIIDNNLGESVILYGATKDVGSLLNAVDVSILSSPSEGLSNTMLESMAMCVPFIGTRIKGITNILGNDYKLLFDVGDDVQLADCIEYVLKEKESVNNIVNKNAELIRKEFSVERLKNETLSIIE